jgi:hypothetical protein
MSWLSDAVLDAALQYIETNTTVLYICHTAEPTTYAQASSTYACGTKATPTFTGPTAGDTSGRKTTVDAITDGEVTATETAAYWALCSADALIVTGSLSASQAVTDGNTFTLTAITITIPDPA